MNRLHVVAFVILAGLPSALHAQEVLPLRSAQMPSAELKSGADKDSCDGLYFADRSTLETEIPYASIQRCAGFLIDEIDALEKKTASRDVNQRLIAIRVNYKKLKKWGNYSKLKMDDADRIGANKALEDLSNRLEAALRSRDLFAQFSATLVTGPSFTETSKNDQGEDQDETLALGTVVWESRHFGDESLKPLDISFGGRVGIQPVLTLVTPEEGDGVNEVTGKHQTAFVWSVGVNAHKQHKAINAESGFFMRTGSAQLMTVPAVIDRGAGSVLALPVDNGSGNVAWFSEAGVEFKMFDNRLAQVHAEKGTTSPQFLIGVAWRHDDRFRAGGPIAGFDRPEQRLVFRMLIDAIQVFDRRAFGEEAKPFTFGFAIEHERSLFRGDGSVPSATRYILRGGLDLMKGLSSTELPDTSAPPPPK